MKTYSVLFAEDVPHYGLVDIKAEDNAAALRAAIAYDLTQVTTGPDHKFGVCQRIVHIEDEEGNIIAEDIPLDDCFLRAGGEPFRLLCDSAPGMLEALRRARDYLFDRGIDVPEYVTEAIARAEGGAP